MTTLVPVSLGERSYQIHIGDDVLAGAGAILRGHVKQSSRRVAVVTDETVMRLHYPAFARGMENAGLTPVPLVLTPGEGTKDFAHLEHVIDGLLAENVERDALIVALGGGVIGDLTGFAAGVYKRGVPFAQVPTTLLSQVDSSVGGKTAINTARGKNLVGLFYQPAVVIADTSVLKTLPKRELLGGYAEIAKYGMLGDADFFAWLEQNGMRALAGDAGAMAHAVAHSCIMKAAIVARDERETGDRALLNLGHTFGHALEAATGFSDSLIHGEGVALGCVLAFKLSARLGVCPPAEAARVERHIADTGLIARIGQISGQRATPAELLGHMHHDKKVKDGRMTFILARGIGHAYISRDVPEDAVLAVLAEG